MGDSEVLPSSLALPLPLDLLRLSSVDPSLDVEDGVLEVEPLLLDEPDRDEFDLEDRLPDSTMSSGFSLGFVWPLVV